MDKNQGSPSTHLSLISDLFLIGLYHFDIPSYHFDPQPDMSQVFLTALTNKS